MFQELTFGLADEIYMSKPSLQGYVPHAEVLGKNINTFFKCSIF